jgi:hypothetical protein
MHHLGHLGHLGVGGLVVIGGVAGIGYKGNGTVADPRPYVAVVFSRPGVLVPVSTWHLSPRGFTLPPDTMGRSSYTVYCAIFATTGSFIYGYDSGR